ncbi:glycosyl transferase group 1 [Thiocapsa marina 5811]|uniref:Glycosyl transferase group 1 n=2 Tax=Thiocapsa marina TaxID=244573 RepID=F9UEX7_9GAMM|nr:glycosyl transferase group 1 [Thiocapsa marina 5811]
MVANDIFHLINSSSHGFEAHFWRGASKRHSQDAYVFDLYGGAISKFGYKVARYLSRKAGLADFIPVDLPMHLLRKPCDYDLYHFHALSSGFSPVSLLWIARRKPSVWTFHDCAPFTGGCVYPSVSDCDAFTRRCGNCPQLHEWPFFSKLDFTGFMQDYKKKIGKEENLRAIVPSRWMAGEVMKSGMLSSEPIIIPNCVDLTRFRPLDKAMARQKLGLPHDSFIVITGAASLRNKRKGFKYAIDALLSLPKKPYVLALGRDPGGIFDSSLSIKFTGYIHDKWEMALYYSSADIFLFPTLADNLPLVAIETMACGTPVVGFRTGGLPEIVDHDLNGWLVTPKDVQGLAEGIRIAMSDFARLRSWADHGLRKVGDCYNPDLFLERHLEVYDALLKRCKKEHE